MSAVLAIPVYICVKAGLSVPHNLFPLLICEVHQVKEGKSALFSKKAEHSQGTQN